MKNLFYLLSFFLLSSCVSHEQVTYFNDLQELETGKLNIPNAPSAVLKKGDLVEVQISSISLETNAYFQTDQSSSDEGFGGNLYQIDESGFIHLPLLGKVKIAGLSKEEARSTIETALLEYVQKPSVNLRIADFKITVLGEVNTPGVYKIPAGEASVLEALGYAGDLTVFGVRENVLLIRDNGVEKSFHRLNLNDSSVLESEHFYLQNNDVIYVQPTKGLTSKDDNIYRILPLVISSLTFIVVIISLNP
ncbi:MAG: polysaccharide export outer membrane protein [Flammeovirgaceae bacterium]|jgi:polysaccharide export outer membrane protein